MELYKGGVIQVHLFRDERKEKQKRIAHDAKNDTQDKQEVNYINIYR